MVDEHDQNQTPKTPPKTELPVGEGDVDDRDPMIEEVFRDLPKVQVSEEFLPRVMSTVFTHHIRTQIRFAHVVVISGLLLALSFLLMIWDIISYQKQLGLNNFNQAMAHRLDLLGQQMTASFADINGVLAAAWQWITGAGTLVFTQTHFFLLTLLVICLAAVGYGIKKYLESLHH